MYHRINKQMVFSVFLSFIPFAFTENPAKLKSQS